MRWAGCDSETPEGAKFCIECDSTLKNCGPSGGGGICPQAKFCAACGSPTGALSQAILHAVSPSEIKGIDSSAEQTGTGREKK